MQYCNFRVPYDIAAMNSRGSVVKIAAILVGRKVEIVRSPSYPSCGSSPYGPWDEADIEFVDGETNCILSYDFMDIGDGMARVFRFGIEEAE